MLRKRLMNDNEEKTAELERKFEARWMEVHTSRDYYHYYYYYHLHYHYYHYYHYDYHYY